MRVAWEAQLNSSGILGYYIGIKPSTNSYEPYLYKSIDSPAENYSIEFDDLKGYTKYTISIQAYNSEDFGPESDNVEGITAEGIPDGFPKGFNCEAVSSEELRVWWESPPLDSLHGVLKSYNVTYAPVNIFDNKQSREYKRVLANETILNGLKKNTLYVMSVSAATLAGDGPQSPVIYCSTETDGKIHMFI